jgi:hypothetical protein
MTEAEYGDYDSASLASCSIKHVEFHRHGCYSTTNRPSMCSAMGRFWKIFVRVRIACLTMGRPLWATYRNMMKCGTTPMGSQTPCPWCTSSKSSGQHLIALIRVALPITKTVAMNTSRYLDPVYGTLSWVYVEQLTMVTSS